MQTTLAIPAALTFKVPEVSYPRMRLSGDGTVIPTKLTTLVGAFQSFVYVSRYLSAEHFSESSNLFRWNDELVFFPVRRTSRIPKILRKLGLRAPTYHHAAAFGLRIKESPVAGTVIFPHEPVTIGGIGNCHVGFLTSGYACTATLSVYKQPIWAVGLA